MNENFFKQLLADTSFLSTQAQGEAYYALWSFFRELTKDGSIDDRYEQNLKLFDNVESKLQKPGWSLNEQTEFDRPAREVLGFLKEDLEKLMDDWNDLTVEQRGGRLSEYAESLMHGLEVFSLNQASKDKAFFDDWGFVTNTPMSKLKGDYLVTAAQYSANENLNPNKDFAGGFNKRTLEKYSHKKKLAQAKQHYLQYGKDIGLSGEDLERYEKRLNTRFDELQAKGAEDFLKSQGVADIISSEKQKQEIRESAAKKAAAPATTPARVAEEQRKQRTDDAVKNIEASAKVAAERKKAEQSTQKPAAATSAPEQGSATAQGENVQQAQEKTGGDNDPLDEWASPVDGWHTVVKKYDDPLMQGVGRIEEEDVDDIKEVAEGEEEERQGGEPKGDPRDIDQMNAMYQELLDAMRRGDTQGTIANAASFLGDFVGMIGGLTQLAQSEFPDYRPSRYLEEMVRTSRRMVEQGIPEPQKEQMRADIRRGLDVDLGVVKQAAGGSGGAVLGNRMQSFREYWNAMSDVERRDVEAKLAAVPLYNDAMSRMEEVYKENYARRYQEFQARNNAAADLVSGSVKNMHNAYQMERYNGKGSVNRVMAQLKILDAMDQKQFSGEDRIKSVEEGSRVGGNPQRPPQPGSPQQQLGVTPVIRENG